MTAPVGAEPLIPRFFRKPYFNIDLGLAVEGDTTECGQITADAKSPEPSSRHLACKWSVRKRGIAEMPKRELSH